MLKNAVLRSNGTAVVQNGWHKVEQGWNRVWAIRMDHYDPFFALLNLKLVLRRSQIGSKWPKNAILRSNWTVVAQNGWNKVEKGWNRVWAIRMDHYDPFTALLNLKFGP